MLVLGTNEIVNVGYNTARCDWRPFLLQHMAGDVSQTPGDGDTLPRIPFITCTKAVMSA